MAIPPRGQWRPTCAPPTSRPDNASVEPSVLRKGLVKTFRIAAIAEAVTWAGLLIGMFFSTSRSRTSSGRRSWSDAGFVMGFYIITVFLVKPELPWGRRELAIGLAASVPPFATYFFERWVVAQAHELDRLDAAARPADQPG